MNKHDKWDMPLLHKGLLMAFQMLNDLKNKRPMAHIAYLRNNRHNKFTFMESYTNCFFKYLFYEL